MEGKRCICQHSSKRDVTTPSRMGKQKKLNFTEVLIQIKCTAFVGGYFFFKNKQDRQDRGDVGKTEIRKKNFFKNSCVLQPFSTKLGLF